MTLFYYRLLRPIDDFPRARAIAGAPDIRVRGHYRQAGHSETSVRDVLAEGANPTHRFCRVKYDVCRGT